ncbi:MAG TPA: TonB-dependent receptor [Candidatus Angelobacter sp.]|nr:TonB-dependent receptor [Candidatus Angelobacter sp.]
MKRTTVFVGLLAILVLPSCVRAQTASIAGTITDSTGASVPNAKITAQNVATGMSRGVQTDESGVYRITNLDPGIYDVQIEHPSFNTVLFSQIPLSVDQVLTLDAKLAVSAIKETVKVASESVAPVDLNDAQVGNLVDTRQVENLPLILRDPYQLILLSPGVVQTNTLFGGFSVNGSRERSNNFMLDGADNNDPDMGGFPRGLSSLNPETTQEFRVLTNSYLPEFGRNNGAIIDIITKQGSNDWHADIYWFGRYTVLSAKDFFAQDRNQDPFVRNQFGYSASGPIQKTKTFFFANEEFQRFSTTILKSSIVPTKEFKTGQFTFLGTPVNALPGPPGTTNNLFGLPLDTTVQAILTLYPNPATADYIDGARGIVHYPSHSLSNANSVTGRIDHDFSEQAMLSVRYTFNQYSDSNYQHEDFIFAPGGIGNIGGTSTLQHNHNLTARLTSTAARGLINELHLAFNRLEFPLTCTGTNAFDGLNNRRFVDAVGRGFDGPLTGDLAGFGCIFLGDTSGSTRNAGTYTAGDNISWVLGRHSIKTGGEYRGVYSNSSNNFASRTITDSAVFSNFGIPAAGTGTSIDQDPTFQNLVWLLYGGIDLQTQAQFFNTAGARTVTDQRGFRQREFAVYAQDSYKIIPNLTFTYGLRYEFFGVPVETQNRMSTLLVSPSGPGPFTFTQVGEGAGKASLYHDDWKDVEPRLSVAWDPFHTGKTSIRAGYGVYHDRVFGQLVSLLRGDPPFQMLETQVCPGMLAFAQSLMSGTPNPSFLSSCALSNLTPLTPFTSSPTVNNCAPAGQPGSQSCSPILPFLVDPNLHTPYSQSWSAGIQIEPAPSLLLEANYVGSKGTHLLRLVDGNPPQPDRLAQFEAFCMPGNPLGCSQQTLQFTNLWLGVNNGSLPPLFPDGNAVANNSAFLQATLYKGVANSIYHALELNITKRFSHGFSVQGAYTFSHAIDDGADPLIPVNNNILFAPYPRSSFNLRAERGNSEFDVTHRLVANYSWQIPVGHGHKHMPEGALSKVVGGWTVSGISTFSSGLPFDIFTSTDTAHTGLVSRPDFTPGASVSPSSDPRTQTGASFALFSLPAFGSGGNLGRNHFRGPGINNSDAVLNKQVGIRERVKLDMRFEFYNLFNRVQFSQPSNILDFNPSAPNAPPSNANVFGHSLNEYVRPDFTTGARQIQLGMKLSF